MPAPAQLVDSTGMMTFVDSVLDTNGPASLYVRNVQESTQANNSDTPVVHSVWNRVERCVWGEHGDASGCQLQEGSLDRVIHSDGLERSEDLR